MRVSTGSLFNEKDRWTTHRIKDIKELVCLALDELSSDVVLGVLTRSVRSLPLSRDAFCSLASEGVESVQRSVDHTCSGCKMSSWGEEDKPSWTREKDSHESVKSGRNTRARTREDGAGEVNECT